MAGLVPPVQATWREGEGTQDANSLDGPGAEVSPHASADDWCIMQSRIGRIHFLNNVTDEVWQAVPPEVKACPSCEAYLVITGLEHQHGLRWDQIQQAKPHPSGRAIILSGPHAGSFASSAASDLAQISDIMDAKAAKLVGRPTPVRVARAGSPNSTRTSGSPGLQQMPSWLSKLVPQSSQRDGYTLLPGV